MAVIDENDGQDPDPGLGVNDQDHPEDQEGDPGQEDEDQGHDQGDRVHDQKDQNREKEEDLVQGHVVLVPAQKVDAENRAVLEEGSLDLALEIENVGNPSHPEENQRDLAPEAEIVRNVADLDLLVQTLSLKKAKKIPHLALPHHLRELKLEINHLQKSPDPGLHQEDQEVQGADDLDLLDAADPDLQVEDADHAVEVQDLVVDDLDLAAQNLVNQHVVVAVLHLITALTLQKRTPLSRLNVTMTRKIKVMKTKKQLRKIPHH